MRVTQREQRDSSNHKLSKKLFEYIARNDSSIGYYGQLRREKNFNNYDTNEYIQTEYEYYRNDSSSRNIYQWDFYPNANGNLKSVTKPNGEMEKYYYHLVSESEVYAGDTSNITDEEPYRRHKFKMKFNTGTIKDTSATMWDSRFPIRIDNYKINGGTIDTLSINYKSYNIAGNPTRTFDRDLYVTEFKYQPIHRINSTTLPGDFSTTPDSVSISIDTNFIQTSLELTSVGWGNYNTFTIRSSNNEIYNYLRDCSRFRMLFDTLPNNVKESAIIKLDTSYKLFNFVTVDSAILRIAPISFSALYNDNPISNSYFDTYVKGIKSLGYPNLNDTCHFPPIVTNQSAQITSAYSEINLDTFNVNNSCGCCYKPLSFDIKNLLNNVITNHSPLLGLSISSIYTGPITDFPDRGERFYMNLLGCSPSGNGNEWYSLYRPRLFIYGKLDQSDTLRYPIVKGGTIKYIYDDLNKKIDVISVRNSLNNNYSKIEYSIDGFGNIKQKDIYTDATNKNSYKYKFNYMNMPARNFDALDDSTMFSYDGLGRLFKTKNSDTSSTLNSYSYLNGLNYYFGTINGLIEIQSFKDEEGNDFMKYYDAVGNMIREVKTLDNSVPVEDNPLNYLITDYKYDSLYRVIKVKTPNAKIIYYSYDGYGRQSKRITPDAGQTIYIYDDLSNLTYTQDANQHLVNNQKYTFRNYDGLNRLTGIGEGIFGIDVPSDGSQYNSTTASDYLTINVYDTISNSIVSNLFFTPSGYTSPLYTKGNLAATAYSTKTSDNWNFKYYSYDERKRVIKLWNIISGFDTLITEYIYNSQDQITFLKYQSGKTDSKSYHYYYDFTGRLKSVNYHTGPPTDNPEEYSNFVTYDYNENSQVSSQLFNNALENTYTYNNRNWVTDIRSTDNYFRSENSYFKNGNVKTQNLSGDYSRNMAENNDLSFNYTYDKSNRLLSSYTSGSIYNLTNTYDKDGNILTLDRKGRSGNTLDSFAYDYYTSTNKLLNVREGKEQFFYDAIGNMTADSLNNNINIKYDYRNLIIQLKHIELPPDSDTMKYVTNYLYDEAGNRIRKSVYKFIGTTLAQENAQDFENDSLWEAYNDEVYSRDVSGKELAIYKNGNVLEYPVYGLDLIGKIKNDEVFFYYKDHLGSVRATVNSSGDVVSAQDYDAWGYLLQDRIFESDSSKFKFTGKERDTESDYDYFGARYYDSRIGRWGEVDPQLSNSPSLTPYNYTSDNPIARIDPSGLDDYYFMSNKTVRTKTDNADRFLVEHSKGNIMGIGSDLVKGYNFFEANSFETVTLHDWNKIDINFKSGKFVEAFNDAIPGILEAFAIKSKYLSAEFYIIYESTGARKMDQKEHVLDIANTLFLFNNILYNKNEAANIVWGAVNAYLGVDPAELAMFYANIASMIQNKRPDEPWDQLSIKRGWYYYDSDFKNFKKK